MFLFRRTFVVALTATSLCGGCDRKAIDLLGSGAKSRPLLSTKSEEVPAPFRKIKPSLGGQNLGELELLNAYGVVGPANFQPSGLLLHQGHLLTVSDKHDHEIFELVLDRDSRKAQSKVWRSWLSPEAVSGKMDFEGITRDRQGNLLLVSEEKSRVLVVPPQGAVYWRGPSLAPLARTVGLFGVPHAKFEGITLLPQGGLLLAAELKPRGLVEIPPLAQHKPAAAWTLDYSAYPLPNSPTRQLDFTDLTLNDGKVFALCRSSHLIIDMVRDSFGWHEGRAWSFAATENRREFLYSDSVFGRAEGLEIENDRLYVILDNNGDKRMSGSRNTQPLLFEFKRPSEL